VGRACHGPSPGERRLSALLDMEALFWLTVAYRFVDGCCFRLEL
jgi:hypothetical protein